MLLAPVITGTIDQPTMCAISAIAELLVSLLVMHVNVNYNL